MERLLPGSQGSPGLLAWLFSVPFDVIETILKVGIDVMMQMPRVPRLTDAEVASTPEQQKEWCINMTVFLLSLGYNRYMAYTAAGLPVYVWAKSQADAVRAQPHLSVMPIPVKLSKGETYQQKDVYVGAVEDSHADDLTTT